MRTLVKAFFVVVALIALTAFSIYAYLSVLDPGDFRDDFAKLVKSTTGRDLVIGGDVSFKFFPAPKLVVENVSLSNAEWGSRPTLVSIDRIVAELALVPLFSRTVSIKSIVLIRPVLNLERNASGESNWNLWQSESPYTGSSALVIDVSNVDVRNGRISYLKHGAGRLSVLKVQNLKLRSKGLFQPLDLWFTGQFNERAVTIRGETGSLASLFKNELFAVDVSINSGGIVAEVEGGLKQPLELRGLGAKLTLTVRDFGQFINRSPRMSGEPLVFTGEGRIRDEKSRYVVDNLELAVGMNDLAGSLSFGSVKGRHLVRGTLSSKLVNVDSLFPKPKSKKRGPGRRVIPDWTLPVKSLRSLDLDINFTGRRVILRGMEFGRLKMKVGLDSGRLRVKPRARLYAGKLDGRIDLDAKADTPRLLMEIRGTKVNMGALLSALKNKQVMSGARGQLYLKLEGMGLNPRAIAASMNGRFLTSVGPGQLQNAAIKRLGADALMQIVRTFDPTDESGEVTSMQCGVLVFKVDRGIATSDRGIVAETKRMNVIGSGTLNFSTEAIDLTLRAQPRDGVGLSAGTLGNVVRVRGTLAEPVKKMDALGALKTGASVGAAVATSGISLLVQGLFNRVIADNAPCKTALKVKPSARKVAPRSSFESTEDRNSR
jgi:uncharacterized protein involved in outer membrane biogenesis